MLFLVESWKSLSVFLLVNLLLDVFGVDEKELLTFWLADKILDTVENENEVQDDAILYAQNVIKEGKWQIAFWSWKFSTRCCGFREHIGNTQTCI